MSKIVFALICVFTLVLTLSGCGYRYPYAKQEAGRSRPVIVFLKLWKNNTNELGLESYFRKALSNWLMQSKQLTLVSNPDTADYIIDGELHSVDFPGSSYDVYSQATVLKSVVTYSISILDTATGKKVYETTRASKESTYSIGDNAVRAQSNKRISFDVIAESISEDIYMHVFYILTKDNMIMK